MGFTNIWACPLSSHFLYRIVFLKLRNTTTMCFKKVNLLVSFKDTNKFTFLKHTVVVFLNFRKIFQENIAILILWYLILMYTVKGNIELFFMLHSFRYNPICTCHHLCFWQARQKCSMESILIQGEYSSHNI